MFLCRLEFKMCREVLICIKTLLILNSLTLEVSPSKYRWLFLEKDGIVSVSSYSVLYFLSFELLCRNWRVVSQAGTQHHPFFANLAQECLENIHIVHGVFLQCSSVAIPWWNFGCFHSRVNCGDSRYFQWKLFVPVARHLKILVDSKLAFLALTCFAHFIKNL